MGSRVGHSKLQDQRVHTLLTNAQRLSDEDLLPYSTPLFSPISSQISKKVCLQGRAVATISSSKRSIHRSLNNTGAIHTQDRNKHLLNTILETAQLTTTDTDLHTIRPSDNSNSIISLYNCTEKSNDSQTNEESNVRLSSRLQCACFLRFGKSGRATFDSSLLSSYNRFRALTESQLLYNHLLPPPPNLRLVFSTPL